MNPSLVPCDCGCGTLIAPTDSRGRPRRFVSGHNAVQYRNTEPRSCTACGQVKPIEAFPKRRGWTCTGCTRMAFAAYYQRNRAAIGRRIAAHYAANPEPKRAYNRQLRLRDPEKHRERAKTWRIANRDKRRLAEHKREARKWGINGHITTEEWDLLRARYGHRCVACGAAGPLQADHVIPLCRGGANTIDNIQPLCGPCNWRKHTATTDYRPLWEAL